MHSICLLLQVHQPYRLRYYPFDRIGKDHAWEDTAADIAQLNLLSDQCYLPVNAGLLKSVQNSGGRLKIGLSISGTFLELLFRYRPDVLDSFRLLAATDCVEFLAGPYYHSLASFFSHQEFRRQVVKHEKAIQQLLEVRPSVLRNTGLLYSDSLLPAVQELGYKTMLAPRKPLNTVSAGANQLFISKNKAVQVLPVTSVIPDTISSLTKENPAGAFLKQMLQDDEDAACLSLELKYEDLFLQSGAASGMQHFLEKLPQEVFKYSDLEFSLPSDVKGFENEMPVYSSEGWASEQNIARDVPVWCSDHMQKDALKQLYSFEFMLYQSGMTEQLDQWGRLQSSNHFLHMSTKNRGNGQTSELNIYGSPYDAYLNYMNVLSSFRLLLAKNKF